MEMLTLTAKERDNETRESRGDVHTALFQLRRRNTRQEAKIDELDARHEKRTAELERRIAGLELYLVALCDVIEKAPIYDANTRRAANAIKITIERTKT